MSGVYSTAQNATRDAQSAMDLEYQTRNEGGDREIRAEVSILINPARICDVAPFGILCYVPLIVGLVLSILCTYTYSYSSVVYWYWYFESILI